MVIKSSEHFQERELRCKCGCGVCQMDDEFMRKLELIRVLYNKPMNVSSAFRCPYHNHRVSKSGIDGPHTTGRAVDIQVYGHRAHQLMYAVMNIGMKGIFWHQEGPHNQRFIHLDDLDNTKPGQPRPWIGSY